MDKLIRVIWVSALSFVGIAVTARIMGKKQLAQLGFIDYVVGISIGSIAGAMAIEPEIPFYHFLVALLIYMVLDIILNFCNRKFLPVKKAVEGRPLILINNGNLDYKALKKSKIDLHDLLSLCRIKHCFDINEIAFCIFETSGEISLLLKSHALNVTCEDLNIVNEASELSTEFVIDGKIVHNALIEQDKSIDWLLEKLGAMSIEDVDNISIATYDSQADSVTAHYKS